MAGPVNPQRSPETASARWRDTRTAFGMITKLMHWTSAAAFIGAYAVVYYLLWFMDEEAPNALPVLNIHWVLGIIVGSIVVPRLIWRVLNVHPEPPAGSRLEHCMAQGAHYALYALLVLMPVTGYLGTGMATNFGLFEIPSFRDTAAFGWISRAFQVTWLEFEAPVDVVHHFVGKWIAWLVVVAHVAAALFHHFMRRDDVLRRMLPSRRVTQGLQ